MLNSYLVSATTGSDTTKSTLSEQLDIGSLLFQDLKRYIPEQNIKVLETASSNQFIALHKEQTTGIPKGIAFILPDINQTIFRQATTSALYQDLDNYGWTSISLTMPHITEIEAKFVDEQNQSNAQSDPETPDTSANGTAEKENANSPNNYAEYQDVPTTFDDSLNEQLELEIGERLDSAFNFARSFPGFYLMICEGKSCFWLTNLIEKNIVPQPDALIMIGAHMPQKELNLKFAEQVAKTEFPVLDIIFERSNHWAIAVKEWRQKMARKNFKTNYRQRELTYFFDYKDQQRRLIKEIYGFTVAVGM